METSYMKLYQNIALRKNKIKSSKNSTQQLKKNKSLTYYNLDSQKNNLNNINDIKINCSTGNNCSCYNKEQNNSILLIAYKKGVLELFKDLKLYMKKELHIYNKLKNDFIQNIQKFYNEEKIKGKKIIKNTSSMNFYLKSYSKKKLIKNNRKSNQLKENLIKNITSNISNQTINKTTVNGISFFKNINNTKTNKNMNRNNNNFKNFLNHNSLYSLMKNNNIIVNSPLKYGNNCKTNNIIKKIVNFSKNITNKNNKINKTLNDKLMSEKENKNNENNKISDIPTKNSDLIIKIKNSLDDNLKHILNFSYENFLNKESERDFN